MTPLPVLYNKYLQFNKALHISCDVKRHEALFDIENIS